MSKRVGKERRTRRSVPKNLAAFKAFLLRNESLGRRECAAEGIRRFNLRPSEADRVIMDGLRDGSLRAIRGEGTGPGRRRQIITANEES